MNDQDIQKLALALKGGDKDSFAMFRGGLKDNWIFLVAVVAGITWLFNNFNSGSEINLRQDSDIKSLTSNLAELTVTVGALADQVDKDNDGQTQMQQDIALIKADINTIKDNLKK